MGKRGAEKRKGQPLKAMDEYVDDPELVRRRLKRGTLDPESARELLGGKHIDEWDLDELAKGRPRCANGTFKGPKPAWVTPQLQEEAQVRFREWAKGELSKGSIKALATVMELISDAESERTRLDASKFTLEYVLGKPTQEIKADVGLQLQGLLAGVLVNPDGQNAIQEAEVVDDEEILDELDLDDE